jgi:hypothetical protein
MLRIGQTRQQVAAFPSFRLGHRARLAAAVTRRVHRPDCSPQQQSGVVVETCVLTVELVSLVEGGGSQIISVERGRGLGHGDERTGPEHWSDIIARGQHRSHRTERDSGFTKRDRAVRKLHVQFVPQPRRSLGVSNRWEQPMSRFPVPTETVERENREVVCLHNGQLVVLPGGHRAIGQQQRELWRAPA